MSFSRVLPTSRVGCYVGKPIENVAYCLKSSGRLRDSFNLKQYIYLTEKKNSYLQRGHFAYKKWLLWESCQYSNIKFYPPCFVSFL